MAKVKEIPVLWIQGSTCTGCSVSVINSTHPSPKNILVDEIIPGVHLNVKYQQTIMGGTGEVAIRIIDEAEKQPKGSYVLVVEGAVPTGENGKFCTVGERREEPVTFLNRVLALSRNAMAVVALGTCSAFGGIPTGKPNPTQCKSVDAVLKENNIATPLINVPGCPPHPDWFVFTIASVLLKGLPKPEEIDEHKRLKLFYGKLIHENCPRRAYFDEGKFAKKLSDDGCLYELGCKGPITYADCPTRLWNNGTNWCVGNNAPCIGCTQPEFPDITAPFFQKLLDVALPKIGEYWNKK